MKRSISSLTPVFNTNRMVEEYVRKGYLPSHRRCQDLSEDEFHRARELAQWRKRMHQYWGQVRVDSVEKQEVDVLHVGDSIHVTARIVLGAVTPADVEVQLYHGLIDSLGDIPDAQTIALNPTTQEILPGGENVWVFRTRIPCRSSGQYGYAVRVLPKHSSLPHSFEPGLVTWG
jgi:starch phosphorylase